MAVFSLPEVYNNHSQQMLQDGADDRCGSSSKFGARLAERPALANGCEHPLHRGRVCIALGISSSIFRGHAVDVDQP